MEEDCVRCLFDVPNVDRCFRKLTSSDALRRANLIGPSGVFSF